MVFKFVSVVVPFRDARANLAECVSSLLSQDYPSDSFEVILVDDGSTDGGASTLSQSGDRIRVLKQAGKGSYSARNRGMKDARGEIFAFTDSDCIVDANWLKSLSKRFDSEGVYAVAGEIKAYKPSNDVEEYYEVLMSNRDALSYLHPYAATANFAFRGELSDSVGLFDEGLLSGGDVDYCFRLQDAGYRIDYEPDAVVYHRNIRTLRGMFNRIMFQSSYTPRVIQKNLRWLLGKGNLDRVYLGHYLEIASLLATMVLPGDSASKRRARLRLTMLTARKLGLIIGSIRYRFVYL